MNTRLHLQRRNEYRHSYIIGSPSRNPLSQFVPVCRVCEPCVCRYSTMDRDELGQWVIRLNFEPKHYSKLIRDKRISHGAFRLWHLFREMTGKNPCCWPSLQTVCREIGCGKESLLGWIGELQAGGYLKVEKRTRRTSNRYFLSGSTQNLTGSIQNRSSGSKQVPELNPLKLNPKKGEFSPTQMILMERELKEAIERRDRIRRNCAQDATGTRFYTPQEQSDLRKLNERIPKLQAALQVPL